MPSTSTCIFLSVCLNPNPRGTFYRQGDGQFKESPHRAHGRPQLALRAGSTRIRTRTPVPDTERHPGPRGDGLPCLSTLHGGPRQRDGHRVRACPVRLLVLRPQTSSRVTHIKAVGGDASESPRSPGDLLPRFPEHPASCPPPPPPRQALGFCELGTPSSTFPFPLSLPRLVSVASDSANSLAIHRDTLPPLRSPEPRRLAAASSMGLGARPRAQLLWHAAAT